MSFQVETRQNAFTQVPAWALPKKADYRALFETLALLGLEDKWIRMDAKTQRAVMGFPIFGKQEFRVDSVTCEVLISRSTCFGTMKETQDYDSRWIRGAVEARKYLSPGVTGDKYMARANLPYADEQ